MKISVCNWQNKLDCHATMLANYMCCIIMMSVEAGLIIWNNIVSIIWNWWRNDLLKQKLDVWLSYTLRCFSRPNVRRPIVAEPYWASIEFGPILMHFRHLSQGRNHFGSLPGNPLLLNSCRMDSCTLLQESNLTAKQPRRAPFHVIQLI